MIRVGVFMFPARVTLVAHDECPRKDRGFLNGRVSHVDAAFDAKLIQFPPARRRTDITHVTVWISETEPMTVVTLDFPASVYPGEPFCFDERHPIRIERGGFPACCDE